MITCNFNNTITERDMDLLLAEVAATDHEFCNLLVDKTDLKGSQCAVLEVEVSKTDNDLGESDVTIVIAVDGDRYGLLIEDKIDAIAMKDQHLRYLKRGEKGIEKGDYKDYRVFIFCPQKYRDGNTEAKKYEHVLTYEECKAYFDAKKDALSEYRSQQFAQAIKKGKKTSSVTVDPDANAFFRRYTQYQKEYYPTLMLTTKENSNGWWSHYSTDMGNNVYIHHKILDGTVDLTFNKAAARYEDIRRIAEWAKYHGIPDAVPQKRGKAASIRINVPKIDMKSSFDDVRKDDLERCFEAIKQLSELATIIETASTLKDL